MAKSLLLLLPTILTAAALLASASAARTGLTLSLIDRFSRRSPFHSSRNLTKSQLARELSRQSRARTLHIERSIRAAARADRANTTTIRPPVTRGLGGLHLVSVSIGTQDAKQSYYLGMDTASGLTWTQCVPCDPCFHQSAPIFNPQLSPSFAFLPCADPLCAKPYECHNGQCTFSFSYLDGTTVAGVISRDAFTLSASTRYPEIVQGLAFGCTHASSDLVGFHGDVDGMLGLDASPESFVTQLGPRAGGRFSYCLLRMSSSGNNFLRFGDDITMNGPVQRTPFETRHGFYFLGLNDLSVDGQRLNIAPGTFDPRSDGSGGVIIDTGASETHLVGPAYAVLKEVMVDYFRRLRLVPVDGREHGLNLDICYEMPRRFDGFPSMTFHLRGADLRIERDALFFVGDFREWFCLMMEPSHDLTIIGAFQQYNTRFTYDLVNRELLFVPEDCSRRG